MGNLCEIKSPLGEIVWEIEKNWESIIIIAIIERNPGQLSKIWGKSREMKKMREKSRETGKSSSPLPKKNLRKLGKIKGNLRNVKQIRRICENYGK